MLQMPTYPCGMCRINCCFVQLVFAKHIAFLSPCSLLCVINAIDWELDLWFLLFAAYSGLCPMTLKTVRALLVVSMGARASCLDISDSFCLLQLTSQNTYLIYRCANRLIHFAFRKYFEQKPKDWYLFWSTPKCEGNLIIQYNFVQMLVSSTWAAEAINPWSHLDRSTVQCDVKPQTKRHHKEHKWFYTFTFHGIVEKISFELKLFVLANRSKAKDRFLESALNSSSTCFYWTKIHSNISLHLTALSNMFSAYPHDYFWTKLNA